MAGKKATTASPRRRKAKPPVAGSMPVASHASAGNTGGVPPIPEPSQRRLRVFAFDPSLATQFQFAAINTATVNVPWEPPPAKRQTTHHHDGKPDGTPRGRQAGSHPLYLGPMGDYVEVIDHDPGSACFYEPIDLNDPRLLAQDGLAPSEANPQFHQQMCYAVSMRVIAAFEEALGRRVLWSPRPFDPQKRRSWSDQFVRRLRIYPHALREPNAYYSPELKALLFGYFTADRADPVNLPGATVFTCLSHDVVAHETTHAVLDGVHPLYLEASNPDVRAFHEAFADIVALFHHFSIPESLKHQIAQTRGDLRARNMLGELAMQFGMAIHKRGALRSAIGTVDDKGRWTPAVPDRSALDRELSPHARGAILVAAVFDAFLMIYEKRTEPIVRLATNGSGTLPPGQVSELLVGELAAQASTSARHVLRMCIRALDYCPPVDLTFGEYLRALLTADMDMVPDDPMGYRVAFVDAFRKRGIYPSGARSLMVQSVAWQPFSARLPDMEFFTNGLVQSLIDDEYAENEDLRPYIAHEERPMDPQRDFTSGVDRFMQFIRAKTYASRTQKFWVPKLHDHPELGPPLGLALGMDVPKSVKRHRSESAAGDGRPSIHVRSVRPARRVHRDGRIVIDLVVELTQDRFCFADPARQAAADSGEPVGEHDFVMRGGCTLLIDVEKGSCRYCVRKSVLSTERLEELRRWRDRGVDAGAQADMHSNEPFAMLHRAM